MISVEGLREGAIFADRYQIVRRLGAGGMGAVYEVLHRHTKRRRALKVLLPILVSDPDARARFAQEATITAEIESDHLVETFDAGIDEATGCPFLVMELLRGESLGDFLADGGRFSPAQVVEILRQLGRALMQTHAAGIIHRDIKPDNLFLVAGENGSVRVKVLDFGIAKLVQQASMSRNTVNIGTPLYMSPEQLDGGRLDHTADLFSLGHVAFELLTGESYWEPELRRSPSTLALLRWMEGPLPEAPSVRAARLNVQVGPGFDTWFMRATARNPAERHQSASELAESFVGALGLGVAALSMAAPLSFMRNSLPSLSEARTETLRGVSSSPRGLDADSGDERETEPRRAAVADAPVPTQRSADAPPRGRAMRAPIALLLGVFVGGLVLALGTALLLSVPVRSTTPAVLTARLSPFPANALPDVAVPDVAVPDVAAPVSGSVSTSGASPSASAAAAGPSATAKTPAAPRLSPRDARCRREPERCR